MRTALLALPAPGSDHRNLRSGFTLIQCLVGLAVIAVLVALLLPAR